MHDDQLKPCPFCGAPAYAYPGGHYVSCANHHCPLSDVLFPRDDWQHRAPMTWTPVTERMPEPETAVLVAYRNAYGRKRVTLADWIPAGTMEVEEPFEGCTQDDDDPDLWYAPEGWYECAHEEGEEMPKLREPVTHWMPVPKHPDKE